MKTIAVRLGVIAAGLLAGAPLVQSQMKTQAPLNTPEERIQNAMSAAPSAIAKDASIMDWPAQGEEQLKLLRKGSNDWTCLPDNAATPANDPMCLDKMWMLWLKAYMSKTELKLSATGIAYMLQGGADASNTDPFAAAPPEGESWMIAPPHLMIITPAKLDPAVHSTDPHSGGPWLMWGGTPYEHLMVPVQGLEPESLAMPQVPQPPQMMGN